jgi:hypothetical protein
MTDMHNPLRFDAAIKAVAGPCPQPHNLYSCASNVAVFFPGKKDEMSETGRLVLCVDDEKIGLQVRRLLLERSGYAV